VMREEGIHWRTLEKILSHSEPPGYRLKKMREKPKIGPYFGRIQEIIKGDAEVPKKQRHTAKRIYERIARAELSALCRAVGVLEPQQGYSAPTARKIGA